jgi:excisionase family DNA binding protein
MPARTDTPLEADCSTLEVARWLGLAVRSVQLMVDRGELDAWKTPGGHRRIARASVERWLATRGERTAVHASPPLAVAPSPLVSSARRLLLIEDSRHYQNLISLLLRQQFPVLELHVADDGIAGLALAGHLRPDVMLVDILLPGIDGATLILGLRANPLFAHSRLIVITSLSGPELEPYAYALADLPVLHKPRLVAELPPLLQVALGSLPTRT